MGGWEGEGSWGAGDFDAPKAWPPAARPSRYRSGVFSLRPSLCRVLLLPISSSRLVALHPWICMHEAILGLWFLCYLPVAPYFVLLVRMGAYIQTRIETYSDRYMHANIQACMYAYAQKRRKNKQTNKQTKKTNKQTNKQKNQTNIHPSIHPDRRTCSTLLRTPSRTPPHMAFPPTITPHPHPPSTISPSLLLPLLCYTIP